MGTAQGQSVIQPGKDDSSHVVSTQVGIADVLGVKPQDVTPATLQNPQIEEVAEKPPSQIDLEDVMAGEKGRPRTDPSSNFLKTFLERLKKKNPQGDVEEVK